MKIQGVEFEPSRFGRERNSKQGKRSDLDGLYVRSRYEANYCRYLNLLIANPQGRPDDVVKWEYEPETFEFKSIKRGTRFYTPDFKVYLRDGHIEYHEVKGWDYPKGQTARKRFYKYYPQLRLVIIDEDWFKAMRSKGYHKLIPNWEEKGD